MSTLNVANLAGPSSTGTAAVLSSINGGQLAGSRNRIINGDMRIDQRNAGAAVTINTTANTYGVDRWFASGVASDGVFTIDQITDAPDGFTNSTRITVTTADTAIGVLQPYVFRQAIEGTNVYDLGFGTASAKTVTVSFWVRSSLTGTFGGTLNNSAGDRNYPFTYSISAANTWEYKTITVAGDTTGTWLTDTGRGLVLTFQIGLSTTRVQPAGSWNGTSGVLGATGATNIIGTLNATWDITGVQLEEGSVATPFERRSYGQELALCQRYYYHIEPAVGGTFMAVCSCQASTQYFAVIDTPVQMRVPPTALNQSGTAAHYQVSGNNITVNCTAVPSLSLSDNNSVTILVTATGQVQGGGCTLRNDPAANGFLGFTAEL